MVLKFGRIVSPAGNEHHVTAENRSVHSAGDEEGNKERDDRILLLSWNIDGLDHKNIEARIDGVINILRKENPDIIFLQEVISPTEEIIREELPDYQLFPGNTDAYYVAVLLKKNTVQHEDTNIIPYPNTQWRRNLLAVKCTVKGVKMLLLTSHLESMRDFSEERKWQLKRCFLEMRRAEPDRTAVFGGDLNIRDWEVPQIGGIPEGVHDVWELTGKHPKMKYTWDTELNDNLGFAKDPEVEFLPRFRFDRVYLKHPTPKVIKPEYFELIGTERLKSCRRFCSDHWGILIHFNILAKAVKIR